MARISDDCANKLCGLVAGTMLIGGGLAVGGGLLPGVAEATVGAVGLAASVLRRGGQEPSKVYARMSRQVAEGVQQQLDAEMPDWAERADAKAAIARLPTVADAIRFEAEAVVAEGLKADGIVRVLMLKAAVIEPLFHPDTGNHSYRQILSAALSETFRVLRADPDFWASLRPDIDEAVFARLDEVIGQQAAIQTALDAINKRIDVLFDQLSLSIGDRERLAGDLARAQTAHDATRSLVLGFLETVLKKQVPAESIARELFALAGNWRDARDQIHALEFSRNLSPELVDLKEQAEAAFARAEIEGGAQIDEALRLVALIEARERDAIDRLDSERDELARRQSDIDDERQARVAGLIATLRTKLAIYKTRLDADLAADTILRIIDLETGDPDARYAALVAEQNAQYEEGRDRGTSLPLEIAVRLARLGVERARNAHERGTFHNGLGNALATLGERESGTARLNEAVKAYRAALSEYTRERVPLNWAMAQNNIGNALQILGARESGTARLNEAVKAYRAALSEHTRERVPLEWATTQNNLGTALQTLGARESGTARLNEAADAYRAALLERTRERVPLGWAMSQNNLGNVLQALGERESGTVRLDEAVEAYRAALLECTRERVPLDWAMTQNNLGTVLQALGARESGTARLNEAVEAYRAALLERTRERVPLDWAMTQNNLGVALQTLGARESGTARLDEAVEAYCAALLEWTRERVPLDWAMTQNNLGNALLALGERESGTARLDEAVDAYRAALLERTRERVPLDWAMTQNNLGNALLTLGERETGAARLDEAVDAYRAALLEWTRERVPLAWAATQNNLGTVLRTLGARESGTARLEEAVDAYRAALWEWTRERVPLNWAMSQYNLGNALLTLGERIGDRGLLTEALAAIDGALEVYTEAGADFYIEKATALRERILTAISR
ncbi:tetratricopeptide repeat protein [Tistrella sp. BH-R2-4]|uniref:Tetratricopeptide repeat protein n=1 Tax=Tistrella arctica TaxID=3133430 RepID=A0ABU9YRS6_9PROT